MTTQNLAQKVSKVASADLSSSQYYGVKLDSDGKITSFTATADIPYGILQDTPVTNEAGAVARIGADGTSKIYLAETVASGALVSLNMAGQAVAAASGSYTVGTLEVGGAAGELGEVSLNNLTIKA